MADFCQQCSIETFGRDFRELAQPEGTLPPPPGYGWPALCEGCGHTIVDHNGKCLQSQFCAHPTGHDQRLLEHHK